MPRKENLQESNGIAQGCRCDPADGAWPLRGAITESALSEDLFVTNNVLSVDDGAVCEDSARREVRGVEGGSGVTLGVVQQKLKVAIQDQRWIVDPEQKVVVAVVVAGSKCEQERAPFVLSGVLNSGVVLSGVRLSGVGLSGVDLRSGVARSSVLPDGVVLRSVVVLSSGALSGVVVSRSVAVLIAGG